MRLVPNLAKEFEEICAEYSAHDQEGKDIVTLVKMFGDRCDVFQDNAHRRLKESWDEFLEDHKHQMTVKMVGMIIYLLLTYWEKGQLLFKVLPTLEKMLLRDTFQEISDEIDRKSAENGDMTLAVDDSRSS